MTNKPEKYYPTADQGSGLWAMAKMIQEGSKWDITVPASLKNGQYIIRTEVCISTMPLS
jgi:cellulase